MFRRRPTRRRGARGAARARELIGGVAFALVLVPAEPLHAQAPVIAPSVQAEVVASAHAGDHPSLLAGVGANVPAGWYARVAARAAAGRTLADGGAVGRLELVGRFLLDPFAEMRAAPYLTGGIATSWRERNRVETSLLVGVGVDFVRRGGWTPAVEVVAARGMRVTVAVRRARTRGR